MLIFDRRNVFKSVRTHISEFFLNPTLFRTGVFYFHFAIFSGLVGTICTFLLRLDMAKQGTQILLGDNPLSELILTGHAFLMTFFVVMPILIGGFGSFFIPLAFNISSLAFPRMNSISFWLLPASLLLLLSSALMEVGASSGWGVFSLISNHTSVDLVTFSLLLLAVSLFLTAVNITATLWVLTREGSNFRKPFLYGFTFFIILLPLSFLLIIILGGPFDVLFLNFKSGLNVSSYTIAASVTTAEDTVKAVQGVASSNVLSGVLFFAASVAWHYTNLEVGPSIVGTLMISHIAVILLKLMDPVLPGAKAAANEVLREVVTFPELADAGILMVVCCFITIVSFVGTVFLMVNMSNIVLSLPLAEIDVAFGTAMSHKFDETLALSFTVAQLTDIILDYLYPEPPVDKTNESIK